MRELGQGTWLPLDQARRRQALRLPPQGDGACAGAVGGVARPGPTFAGGVAPWVGRVRERVGDAVTPRAVVVTPLAAVAGAVPVSIRDKSGEQVAP